MRTTIHTVADIHCGGCEGTIRTLVGDIEGVHEVKPDRQTNQVVITYDETILDDQAILEALTNSGFPPIS